MKGDMYYVYIDRYWLKKTYFQDDPVLGTETVVRTKLKAACEQSYLVIWNSRAGYIFPEYHCISHLHSGKGEWVNILPNNSVFRCDSISSLQMHLSIRKNQIKVKVTDKVNFIMLLYVLQYPKDNYVGESGLIFKIILDFSQAQLFPRLKNSW